MIIEIKSKDKPPQKKLKCFIPSILSTNFYNINVELLECEQCGAVQFEKTIEKPDHQWLTKNIRDFNPRASPKNTRHINLAPTTHWRKALFLVLMEKQQPQSNKPPHKPLYKPLFAYLLLPILKIKQFHHLLF